MRAKINNLSSRPDEIVIALAEFAATFFPHVTGEVPVIVKNTKRDCHPHGKCYGNRRCVVWIHRDDCYATCPATYPKTFDQMHYFRHANHETVQTLAVADWQEHLLSIIAHEMEHTTRGNRQMRRSKQEVHAWNRSVEVVEAFRLPDNRDAVVDRINQIIESRKATASKKDFAKSPDGKILHLGKLLDKWQRKAKMAQAKIRKLKTRMKYYERKIAASKGGAM